MTNPTTKTLDARIIEADVFAFEFLSELAERESWRKEIHRPVYHVHKWWAQRLGSVFRGLLLGAILPPDAELRTLFFQQHHLANVTVLDPFMGSGTTIGEAHKLGMTALGRDINPVAVRSVRTAMGPLDRRRILAAYDELAEHVEQRIRALYQTCDRRGLPSEVLYYFWVMQAQCPDCSTTVDLFPSHIVARNAHPKRKTHVQVRCPACADIFQITRLPDNVTCGACGFHFDATKGNASGAKATCTGCKSSFTILKAIGDSRPRFRLFGKLVLRSDGRKEYLSVTDDDLAFYRRCSETLSAELNAGRLTLPSLCLTDGHNTRQAMNYNFRCWADFFNDRQLLALGWLRCAILNLDDAEARDALLTLFSGALEFNNLFASYKGEGTGAVRHMFSHHILKPERMPIEANVWGTPKSSGGFSNLLRSRLLRAIEYREAPTELNVSSSPARVCSPSFTGRVEPEWPTDGAFSQRGIYLSTGDSALTGLPDRSVDIVATDPPFFDNVHYSELADFFYAWQLLGGGTDSRSRSASTRQQGEVQDADADQFAHKLRAVFTECHRVMRDDGLLVFTYHHSRPEGWRSLATAVWGAGFRFVNAHPVKAEMSVATPKFQAKEPIQLDIILVCRKRAPADGPICDPADALERARAKLYRLANAGFVLSRNDRRITLVGQLLCATEPGGNVGALDELVERALEDGAFAPAPTVCVEAQMSLF
ncbi:MAG: DNA methyltransferase [Phycisphaeraceae bacterium]